MIRGGNLTMGGTGKTPTVVAIGQLLQREGCRVSVLLRGYKGKNNGRPLLVSDGKSLLTSSRRAGDEALVIAKNLPGAIVAVGTNRTEVGRWVEKHFAIDVHILDDGFQHLRLYRDLNLLLIDVTNPFGGDHLPPLGRLRESLAGIRRADVVLLTRTQPGHDYEKLVKRVRYYKAALPCLRVTQKLVVSSVSGDCSVTALENRAALAFAGIAHPAQFFDSLRSEGMRLTGTMSFPDHHRYTTSDLDQIKARCLEQGIENVVTTEKDAENLQVSTLDPLRLILVKVVFEFDEIDQVRKMLLDSLRETAS